MLLNWYPAIAICVGSAESIYWPIATVTAEAAQHRLTQSRTHMEAQDCMVCKALFTTKHNNAKSQDYEL